MTTPQDEAIALFKSVLDSFFTGTVDIKKILRHCFHACQILCWNEQLEYFNNELQGYPSGVELPSYRKIVGYTKWLTTGGFETIIDSIVDDRHRTQEQPTESVTLDVWAGIDWVISVAQHGYSESTGKKSKRYISFRRQNIEIKEFKQFSASSFQTILKSLENRVFKFVSNSYSLLCYRDSLHDIWQAYATEVDKSLIDIGFSKHLDAIRSGLNSTNPQEWRQAMWSCRDILHDLADYLWQDPRDTYEFLPGEEGKLSVTKDKYINRLGAYLHCKGTTGEIGAYLRSEMQRIYSSIDKLNDLDSKAHDTINLSEVRTAAIGTYFILGEICMRTDMQPITNYDS